MTKALYILYILLLLLLGAASPVLAQTINGEVYGGGELAQVEGNTAVVFNQGTLGSAETAYDIYGGGYGGEAKNTIPATAVYGTVTGAASVTIKGGTIHGDVFGGGAGIEGDSPTNHSDGSGHKVPYYMAGWVRQQTTVTMSGGAVYGNIFGGGDLANTGWYTSDKQPKQEYQNQSNVTMRLATAIYLNGGNVYGKVFGGGNGRKICYQGYTNGAGKEYRTWYPELIGSVCGSTLVSIGTKDGEGHVSGDAAVWNRIYGGGQTGKIYNTTASAKLNGKESDARDEKTSGSTNVEMYSGSVGHNIFGGGLGDVVEVEGKDDVVTSADIYGSTYVYFGHGTKLIWPKYFDGKQVQSQQAVMNGGDMYPQDGYIDDGHGFMLHSPNISHNLYGGGNEACEVKGNTNVYMTGAPVPEDLSTFLTSQYFTDAMSHEGRPHFSSFGAGHGYHTKTTGEACSDVCLGSGDVMYNVIGGGLNGTVEGGCLLHVGSDPTSTITNVYGGGYYAAVNGAKVDITKGNIKGNVFGGGLMGDVNATTNPALSNIMPNTTNTTIGLQSTGDYSYVELQDPNAGALRKYEYSNEQNAITIAGSVYGGNDVSGVVSGVAGLTIYGGTINQNVYGAGNGDHIGYYEPGRGHFNDGVHGNYYPVDHSGDTGTGGNKGPKGLTYKGRPQTTGGVELTLVGNSTTDRATVLGQVFGGGNSCTIGEWDADLLNDTKYHGDPHLVRDDPDYFLGGGQLHINLGSHVTIGRTNTALAALDKNVEADKAILDNYTNEDGENVSGLFMGNNGAHLATQSTAKDDYYYHHYYDKYTAKYWPGFAVYNDAGSSLLTRAEGLKSFNAYLNNILVWTNDVQLNFAPGAEDIWIANFVGGGFRGSMKRKDNGGYSWTLPNSVTVGNCVIGGAYNTDVVYRIYATSDGHTYTTATDPETGVEHYLYLTTPAGLQIVDGEHPNGDYHHLEKDVDDNITGIVRFMYGGGLLGNDGNPTDVALTLNNNMVGGEAADVFGGCYSSGTVKNTQIDYYATDAHSVYGGGALANISGNSVVNLLGGSLTDAYGGGLGRNVDMVNRKTAVSALVFGDATVTLNGSVVNGSIFGANNVNGTPLGHVKVHVLKTTPRDEHDYDVDAVYGGGNQAAYVPTGSIGEANSLTDKTKFAEVLIETCDNSIEYVYGGGNAAPVPATDVTIYGGIISKAFAGGNGKGVDEEGNEITDPENPNYNHGADIGYLGFYSQTGEETPKYGVGTTNMTIYGGTIQDVYGGSNTLGYIRTSASVAVDRLPVDYEGDECPLNVTNVHGGGNNAPMYCNGSVTMNCTKGVDVVFGGAQNADIHGNIELNITSGTYKQVFTGNDSGGNIFGRLKVNIDETGCWPIIIGELYGCGNDAAYSVYGYDGDGNCITSGEKQYDDPVVNVVSCTSIGKVFGAGKGSDATLYGDPTVNINTINGIFAGQTVAEGFLILNNEGNRVKASDAERAIPAGVGTIGTVYGGGNQAAVHGNTIVNIGTLATNKHLNADPGAEGEDVNVKITDDVFGGGKTAEVTGKTTVNIGKE